MEVSRRSIREGKKARTEIDVSHLSSRIIRVGNKSKNDPDWNTIDLGDVLRSLGVVVIFAIEYEVRGT